MRHSTRLALAAAVTALTATSGFAGPFTDETSVKGAIKGEMSAKFNTRTDTDRSGKVPPGSPALGAKDIYNVNLEINNSVLVHGSIERQPWLPTARLGTTAQAGQLAYDLKFSLRNPAKPEEKVTLGGWLGAMSLDGDGVFRLASPPEGLGPMRIATDSVGRVVGFVSNFDGKIEGRVPEQAGLWGLASRASKKIEKTYVRYVDGKVVAHTVKGADPMHFDGVTLAKGPLAAYPDTRASGSIDYDAEAGIWHVDFGATYNADGKVFADRYSGTIRWNEHPNRKANGLGFYDVNVRLNEKEVGEAAAFSQSDSAEEAFFAADNRVPGFTGKIEYVDTFRGDKVTASRITWNVDANQASKIQTLNFAKVLLLMVGPFNDE